MRHVSAGGIVVGLAESIRGKVIVVQQAGKSWSLPKGGIEPGESAEETALREIAEESGAQARIIKHLGEYERPTMAKDGLGEERSDTKHITLFLCTTNDTVLQPKDPDNPEARWVPIDEVADLLTRTEDQVFFDSVVGEIREFLAG